LAGRAGLRAKQVEELLGGALALLTLWLGERRQGWARGRAGRDVVEACDRELLRDGDAGGVSRVERPEREQVAEGKDRGGRACAGEQSGGGGAAPGGRALAAFLDRDLRPGDAGGCAGVAAAGQAAGGKRVRDALLAGLRGLAPR
jgi:hypothetical protein